MDMASITMPMGWLHLVRKHLGRAERVLVTTGRTLQGREVRFSQLVAGSGSNPSVFTSKICAPSYGVFSDLRKKT